MLKHKKIVLIGITFSAAAIAAFALNQSEFNLIQTAYAQASRPDQLVNDTYLGIGIVLGVFHWLTMQVVHLLELLLNPKLFIELSIGEDGENPLKKIWMYSRDIVNIVFAVLLVAGGVMTIITAKKDIIMQNIPRFILAVILVNFSWFFPRVVIDAANVLTTTIYSLPRTLGVECKSEDFNGEMKKCQIWDSVVFNVTNTAVFEMNGFECIDNMGAATCYRKVDLEDNANSPQGIILGLIISHGKLFDLVRMRQRNNQVVVVGAPAPLGGQSTRELFNVMLNIIFALILTAALLFPLLAMLVAFIVRIPYLWITISLMPFMFIGFVLKGKMGEFDTMKIWKKFVASAFLPAAVAVPMAIGFILINVTVELTSAGGTEVDGFMGDQNFKILAFKSFLDVLWYAMVIAVIWIGTFTAFKIDETYAKIGNTFKGLGEKWGKLGAMMPLRIPLIPVKDQAGVSHMASPLAFAQQWGPGAQLEQMRSKARKEAQDIWGGGGTAGADLKPLLDKIADQTKRERITNDFKTQIDIVNNYKNDPTNNDKLKFAKEAIAKMEKLMTEVKSDAKHGSSDMADFAKDLGKPLESILIDEVRKKQAQPPAP